MDEKSNRGGGLPLVFAALAIAPSAMAQGVNNTGEPMNRSRSVIEEVLVTAQRREQNLQDVPISISAVTADAMETMGVEDTTDLAAVAPSLNVTRQWGSVTPYIRGVGTPLVLGGNESAVALYVDGIYVPQLAALTFSFNNIERVEVLKGPQGTLFGRNATGGLIQVVTRDPVSETTLQAKTRVDNYKTIETSLYGSTGLADGLNGDLALYVANQNEGYGENIFSGKDTYKRNELGARSALLWDGAATQVRFSLDYFDTKSSIGMGRQADKGARTVDGQGPQEDYWNINSNFEPLNTMEQIGATLKVSHDFDSVQLVSLSGYRDGHNKYYADQDATPLAFVDGTIDDDAKTFSQEVQLQSLGSGPLSWIVGLYYFNFDVDYRVDTAGTVGPLVAIGGLRTVSSTQDTTSLAAYAQGSYELDDRTNLTLGLRHTTDDRDFAGTTFLPFAPAPFPTEIPGSAPDNETAEELTWRIAIDHRFTDDVLGYVSYNRGFKSGVYNMINPDDEPVESETVDAYEIGVKTDLFSRRLRFNTSLFFYNYDELQAQTIDQGTV